MKADTETKAIKPSRAIELYSIPRDRLYRAINTGELPTIDLSLPGARRKTFSILIADLETWLEKLKKTA